MKTIVKIVAAGLILLVVSVAGCTALVSAGAHEASKAIDKAEKRDTARAAAFRAKFAKVHAGDTLTGAGGMSKVQVAAILGHPKAGDIAETRSSGDVLTTWSYDFVMSKGSMMYSVDFTNGRVSGKSRV